VEPIPSLKEVMQKKPDVESPKTNPKNSENNYQGEQKPERPSWKTPNILSHLFAIPLDNSFISTRIKTTKTQR
jgi:hypothetical protein